MGGEGSLCALKCCWGLYDCWLAWVIRHCRLRLKPSGPVRCVVRVGVLPGSLFATCLMSAMCPVSECGAIAGEPPSSFSGTDMAEFLQCMMEGSDAGRGPSLHLQKAFPPVAIPRALGVSVPFAKGLSHFKVTITELSCSLRTAGLALRRCAMGV